MSIFSQTSKDLVVVAKTMKRVGALGFHKAYPQLIIDTNFLHSKATIAQRLWHVEHEVLTVAICTQCECAVSWNKESKSYRTYCSSKCAHSDIIVMNGLRDTNMKKYGCASPLGNKTIRAKAKATTIERYGVNNISQLEEIKLKKQNTSMLHFGTAHPLQCSTVKQQLQQTCLKKYGHTNVLASEYGKNKTKQTMNELYGKSYTNQQHILPETIQQLTNKEWLYNEHVVLKQSLTQIANDLKINDTTVGKYLHQHGIKTQIFFTSIGEQQIREFMQSLGILVSYNDRSIISPLELDIYMPEYNLAIEYCGLYWHSEQQGKTKQYHANKYKKCKELGIQLITIFEDEWMKQQEQIKRKLQHLIRKNNDKVYARHTNIVDLSTTQKNRFFNENHIQGTGPGSVTYGLMVNSQVVAAMSFIKQKNGVFVLNRYATSFRVVGGFTKLLNHFKLYNTWTKLVSFADLRWSDGRLYQSTGWQLDKILPPDYYYSPDGHNRIHKFNYRRKNLPRLLKSFDPELSETQNCDINNVLRIWDCGKMRFVILNIAT